MSDKSNREKDELLTQLISRLFNEQLDKSTETNRDQGKGSYVFLDSQTIDLLICYLIMNLDRTYKNEVFSKKASVPQHLLNKVDNMLEQNREQFGKLITLLTSEDD
ncbi:hypothetical protein [Thalassobacillus devorans]|uniref:hypothetical protein n=1 Tax=Thalassobacillus devorans TaxID=279813 RepID=UPI00048C63DF|nr:hypothetical protein [Thalassobacillus devorans]